MFTAPPASKEDNYLLLFIFCMDLYYFSTLTYFSCLSIAGEQFSLSYRKTEAGRVVEVGPAAYPAVVFNIAISLGGECFARR
jgi:hypothetical protein